MSFYLSLSCSPGSLAPPCSGLSQPGPPLVATVSLYLRFHFSYISWASLFLSLSLTHTHTHTHTVSLSHTHTRSLSLTHTVSLSHTHTFIHCHSHTHTHSQLTIPEPLVSCGSFRDMRSTSRVPFAKYPNEFRWTRNLVSF